jgi:NADPH-dependent curcumin reductase CurA
MATVNRKITLAARPLGFPKVSDFHLVYAPVPSLAAGEVLVRSIYLSLDPCLRRQMSDTESGAPAVGIGEVVIGAAVACVVESKDPDFRDGDAVLGMLGWQEYAVAQGHELRKIDPGLGPISTALGVLGTPGLTAFFGLLDVCDPHRGETVVVSGATGAVGMLAGQIAKIKGCRVVGLAGEGVELSWLLDELGFDGAANYQLAVGFDRTLEQLCPDGVDAYFDNMGGAVTDAVARRVNASARICTCGRAALDNLEQPEALPRWLAQSVVEPAVAQGFLVSRYAERFAEGLEQLTRWLRQGRLQYREDVAQGIEAAPLAFIGMLQEKNQGQQLVQLSGP